MSDNATFAVCCAILFAFLGWVCWLLKESFLAIGNEKEDEEDDDDDDDDSD